MCDHLIIPSEKDGNRTIANISPPPYIDPDCWGQLQPAPCTEYSVDCGSVHQLPTDGWRMPGSIKTILTYLSLIAFGSTLFGASAYVASIRSRSRHADVFTNGEASPHFLRTARGEQLEKLQTPPKKWTAEWACSPCHLGIIPDYAQRMVYLPQRQSLEEAERGEAAGGQEQCQRLLSGEEAESGLRVAEEGCIGGAKGETLQEDMMAESEKRSAAWRDVDLTKANSRWEEGKNGDEMDDNRHAQNGVQSSQCSLDACRSLRRGFGIQHSVLCPSHAQWQQNRLMSSRHHLMVQGMGEGVGGGDSGGFSFPPTPSLTNVTPYSPPSTLSPTSLSTLDWWCPATSDEENGNMFTFSPEERTEAEDGGGCSSSKGAGKDDVQFKELTCLTSERHRWITLQNSMLNATKENGNGRIMASSRRGFGGAHYDQTGLSRNWTFSAGGRGCGTFAGKKRRRSSSCILPN